MDWNEIDWHFGMGVIDEYRIIKQRNRLNLLNFSTKNEWIDRNFEIGVNDQYKWYSNRID